jgi:hypothetical protein
MKKSNEAFGIKLTLSPTLFSIGDRLKQPAHKKSRAKVVTHQETQMLAF